MVKLGILASTKATDMQAVIDAIKTKELNAKISVLISDKKDAYALERAKKNNIPCFFIDSKGKDREQYDKEISQVFEKFKVELILLIGYMRIISKWMVDKYKNKIMNIHPSLLPAFAGGMDLDVHKKVLDSGVKITGATLHFVTESLDAGPIIMQKAVNVDSNDTIQTLKDKVQKAEQEILLKGINLLEKKRLKIENNKVIILNQNVND